MKVSKNLHTTNFINTFIEVAEDTKAIRGTPPKTKKAGKTIAEMQFDLIAQNPYKFSSDDVIFQVYALRNDITDSEYTGARELFFSKGQPCLRTSPLTKSYGFGIHNNNYGKIAIYGMETEEYQNFVKDTNIKKVKAMRSSKK